MELFQVLDPLLKSSDFISGWIDARKVRKFRIIHHSDVPLKLELTFSMDRVSRASIHSCILGTTWRSDVLCNPMYWFQVRIINEKKLVKMHDVDYLNDASDNNQLHLTIIAEALRPVDKEVHFDPIIQMPDDVARTKSDKEPKKSIFSRNKESPKIPLLDERLPPFIGEGSLLIGGRSGRVCALPKGQAGQQLIMGPHGPEWV